jgi:hypothetical protein
VAVVEMGSFLPRRWWRRWPPLPLPDKAWMAFRMETAFGDPKARPSGEDTLAWLDWCAKQRRPPASRR